MDCCEQNEVWHNRELEIKLVAIDIDGTLLNKRWELTPYTLSHLRALIEQYDKSIKFILVTGRSYHGASPVLRTIDMDSEWVICNNGAVLSTANQYQPVIDVTLNNDKIDELYLYCAEHDINVSSTIESGETVFFNDLIPSFHEQHLLWEATDNYIKVNRIVTCEKILQCTIFMDKSKTADMLNFIEHYLGYSAWLYAHNGYDVIEMTNKNVNKWTMLMHYMEKYHLNANNVVAIGNGLNDVPMVENAGYGVSMGDGEMLLQQVADEVIASCNNDGVVRFLDKFLAEHGAK